MVTRNEIEKISLTRRQLREVINPPWRCFGKYAQVGCDVKCTKRAHLFCRKVTRFLGRTQ